MSKFSFFGIKELIRDRNRLTVFIVFLGLSAAIWLLISLGHTYNATIMVPVRYENFPENKTLLNEVPHKLAINVAGSGYNLIKYRSKFDMDTLPVNMDNLNMSMWGAYQRGYLDANDIGKVLQQRAGGALSINRVLSDTISFVFDLKVARNIRVKPQTSFTVAPGYTVLDSGHVSPAEIEVFGALTLLDTLSYLHSAMLQLGEIKKSVRQRVPLDLDAIGTDVSLGEDSVTVSIEIDQLTEKRLVLQPEVINLPDSLQMLLFPKSVEVSCQVALSLFSNIEEEDFQLVIDYQNLEQGLQILPVELISWPSIAKKIKVQPDRVEFVITEAE